jgi:hypothetical protein
MNASRIKLYIFGLLLVSLALVWHCRVKENTKEALAKGGAAIANPTRSVSQNMTPPNRSPGKIFVTSELNLERIDMQVDSSAPAFRNADKQSGFRVMEGKIPGGNDWSSWQSPNEKLVLVAIPGGQKYRIYDCNAALKCEPPNMVAINGKTFFVENWLWKDDNALVGYAIHDPNVGTGDESGNIDDTKVLLYHPDDPLSVRPLASPKIEKGHVVRLEGISKEGWLILSQVIPRNADVLGQRYPYEDGEKMLGAFEIGVPPGK